MIQPFADNLIDSAVFSYLAGNISRIDELLLAAAHNHKVSVQKEFQNHAYGQVTVKVIKDILHNIIKEPVGQKRVGLRKKGFEVVADHTIDIFRRK